MNPRRSKQMRGIWVRQLQSKITKTYKVADLFCGAGGSSTGALKAIEEVGGKMDLVAINHWNIAIETHQANHPTARHLVEDVSVVDPETVVEGGHLDLLMASPECKFYSRARGGKPIHDQGRMNPWAIHNWLTKLDVTCVLIENVPEFVDWGPLNTDGRPDKSRKGRHFEAWFLTFHTLGYQAEWRLLNAADYGDATTRKRFFLMARNDERPVVWPEPTHAKGDTGMFPGRLPWRGAKEIIDWSNPGRSLLDDPKYRKKPLSKNTRRRIARGLERFGGSLAPLYIRLLDLDDAATGVHHGNGTGEPQPFHGSDRQHTAPRNMDEPILTVTTLTGGGGYMVQPLAQPFIGANRNNSVPKDAAEPIPTVTTAHGGGSFLVEPEAKHFLLGQQSGGAPRPTDQPAPTVTGDGAISLIQPAIIEYYGRSSARDIDAPLSAITSMNKHGLANPTLVEYYGRSDGASVDEPLPTVTPKARHGLANPTLVEVNHGGPDGNKRRIPALDEPLGTLTSKRGVGLVEPVLVQTGQTGGNGIYARPTNDPLPTLTTKRDVCLAAPDAKPYIVPNFGERDGQAARVHDLDDPVPAVTSRGAGSLVSPILLGAIMKQIQDQNIDPQRLVFVDGRPYILDIRFRMLQNPELARAMGFDDEESKYEFHGNIGQVTRQIGNAVPVRLAAALVRATLKY